MSLEIYEVQCPYCGETIEVEFETMDAVQQLIEDCTVCCRPIQYDIVPGEDRPSITASRSE